MLWHRPERVDKEGHEAMHFNLKKAVGLTAVPLLGGALAVGATALPASAQTFQDTALQAVNLTQPPASTGAVVNGLASRTPIGTTLPLSPPHRTALVAL